MASPINTFRSVAVNVTTTPTIIYSAPIDTTTIVLLAQATNVGSVDSDITFYTSLNGTTELVKDYTIPVGDAGSVLQGKLVLEPGTSMGVVGNSNNNLKFTISFLETR
jgi:hypothetical protein